MNPSVFWQNVGDQWKPLVADSMGQIATNGGYPKQKEVVPISENISVYAMVIFINSYETE